MDEAQKKYRYQGWYRPQKKYIEDKSSSTVKQSSTVDEDKDSIIFAKLESEVNSIAVSPDGRRVIAGLEDGTLNLFDLITGTPIGQPFKKDKSSVRSVAFSPSGNAIVSGSDDGTLQVWNLDGTPTGEYFQGHQSSVRSVAFSPSGNAIVSGGDDGTLRVWNLDGTTSGDYFQESQDIVWEYRTSILSVAFSPDGNTIVSGGKSGKLQLWNLNEKPVREPFGWHESLQWDTIGAISSVAFSPDGKTIVSAGGSTLHLWNLDGTPIGHPFFEHRSTVESIAFSPDGKTIVSAGGSTLHLWNLDGTPIGQPFFGHRSTVESIAFSSDGKTIVSGSQDCTLRLWNVDNIPPGQPFFGHRSTVESVAFSPDGKTIVSAGGDCKLWDISGTPITQNDKHPFSTDRPIHRVAFSPSGKTIISQSFYGGILQQWNLDGTSINKSIKGSVPYNALAFSPDGNTAISRTHNDQLQLWNLDNTSIKKIFQGHQSNFISAAFSPDGKTVISSTIDGLLQLWNLDGKPIGQPIKGHQATAMAFSSDGKAIIISPADGLLQLWNLDGKPIGQPIKGHQATVKSIALSPDGKTIVSGSDDTSISLWRLEADNTLHRLWTIPEAIATPIRNLADRREQVLVPQSAVNDLAKGSDQLNIQDEIEALATVLMLRRLQPPMAVGILGTWGSGKSFGMHLMQQKINALRSQPLTQAQAWGDSTLPSGENIMSPYVGHVYQIRFNAWSYAKSDLWASLMQEIFSELNRQISLEQQLGRILPIVQANSKQEIASRKESAASDSKKNPQEDRYIDIFIYQPLSSLRNRVLTLRHKCDRRFKTLFQKILNFGLIQFFLHIIIFFISIVLSILSKVFLLLNITVGKKVKVVSKLLNFLSPLLFFNWHRNQLRIYYFPYTLKVSNSSWRNVIESVIERLLFLCLVGFRKRLGNRQQINSSLSAKTEFGPLKSQDSHNAKSTIYFNRVAFAKALREGGDFWQVLYNMNDEERTTFLQANLKPTQFNGWKQLTSSTEVSNSLWKALDTVKQTEQALFKAQEQELQQKEKELQRQLKSAETGVNQSLAKRKLVACWIPVVNAFARLRFSNEEIEDFATTGKTGKMLRQTFKSWQGLIALFAITLATVIALDPESRTALSEATQTLLTPDRSKNSACEVSGWQQFI